VLYIILITILVPCFDLPFRLLCESSELLPRDSLTASQGSLDGLVDGSTPPIPPSTLLQVTSIILQNLGQATLFIVGNLLALPFLWTGKSISYFPLQICLILLTVLSILSLVAHVCNYSSHPSPFIHILPPPSLLPHLLLTQALAFIYAWRAFSTLEAPILNLLKQQSKASRTLRKSPMKLYGSPKISKAARPVRIAFVIFVVRTNIS